MVRLFVPGSMPEGDHGVDYRGGLVNAASYVRYLLKGDVEKVAPVEPGLFFPMGRHYCRRQQSGRAYRYRLRTGVPACVQRRSGSDSDISAAGFMGDVLDR
jgi:hypothetical protein